MISCLYDIVPLKMPAMCNPGMPSVFAQWFKSSTHLVHGLRLYLARSGR